MPPGVTCAGLRQGVAFIDEGRGTILPPLTSRVSRLNYKLRLKRSETRHLATPIKERLLSSVELTKRFRPRSVMTGPSYFTASILREAIYGTAMGSRGRCSRVFLSGSVYHSRPFLV